MNETVQDIAQEDKTDAMTQLKAEKMIFAPSAKLEEVKIIEKYAIVVYDIPASKEGNQARNEFLERARFRGAVMLTESVYLAPWNIVNDLEILRTAKVGQVYIFGNAELMTDEERVEITRKYDTRVAETFKEEEDRFAKIVQYVEDGRFDLAHRMMPKSEREIAALKKIAIGRGSQWLYDKWETLSKQFHGLFSLLPTKVKTK